MSERQRAPIFLSRRTEQQVCGYCREALGAGPWVCLWCHSALHADCARELERCPSLGCAAAARVASEPPRTERSWALLWLAGSVALAIPSLDAPLVFLATLLLGALLLGQLILGAVRVQRTALSENAR